MEITVRELAVRLAAEVRNERDVTLRDVAPLASAGSGELSFVESPKQFGGLKNSQATAVLITADLAARATADGPVLIVVKDPFGAFMQAAEWFRPARPAPAATVSAAACIHPTACIGPDTHISPGVFIGADVKIGARCTLLPGVVVQDGAVIGDDCLLHPQVVLYADVRLGQRVIVHANAVIGSDGFGYRFVNGAFQKIPHRGTVIVEDDVEIGACTTIDRGMISPTVIGRGTKLDNLVQIAHNCRIGRHNAFAAQVGFAGSCSTGDYVRAGGQVGVADHITIGNRVAFGGKAGVITDVPDGVTYHGIPAGPEKDQIRREITLRRAPEVFDQVKQLQKQLLELQAQVARLTAATATDVESQAA